ncbi:glycosyltransferase family 39 protein, partial [Candidatus Curtissbacteria bacterium]|nr:glycosyltransferase family 39 protein [Candidatus Curtissbacteria bacterium]
MIKKNIVIFLIILLASVLRLIALDRYPAGLNADEASIGYNAYSLIQTGKDEHGASWPLVFRSFDDYKPGVYFYLVLPFVKFLGLNVLAVRFPSALLGIASVYFIYLIVKKIFPNKKYLPELAALMLA